MSLKPHYHILVNPASASGRGRRIWHAAEDVLLKNNIPHQTVYSKSSAHIRDVIGRLTERTKEDDPVRLIVIGGDGTLNTVVDSADDLSRVRMGVIPSGSGNDFARALSLKDSPAVLMERILEDKVRRTLDIGVVHYLDHALPDPPLIEDTFRDTHRFVVSAGIGFDAGVCAGVLQFRYKKALNRLGIGAFSYLAVALREVFRSGMKEKSSCTLTFDDESTISLDKLMFVAAMNTGYEGGGFLFGPDADPSDGQLDLCVVGDISVPRFLTALPSAKKGTHFRFNGVDHYAAKSVGIRTGRLLWVHTDGETIARASHIRISLMPSALKMLD